VKEKLLRGEAVLGTFIKLYDPTVVELFGLLGFDFFVIDNEHVAMSRERMVGLLRASDISGIVPIVRVRENRPVEILQALDEGALGVMVPQVDHKEEALTAIRSIKYAPAGERGYAPTHRAAGYGTMDPVAYAQMSNEMTLSICYCETVQSMKHLADICSVEDLDVIFIGPLDLSQSLGVIGQPKHPKVVEAMERIIRGVRASGKAVGTIASDMEEAARLIDLGVQYITISSDLGMIGSAGKRLKQQWNERLRAK
jgi:4-hydroxy-2-oxoheptanedioate aldolase